MDHRQLYRRIGALVREHRKQRHFTQEALSQGVGMSRAALANIEAGRQQMLVHQLYAIARVLEVKLAELLPAPTEASLDGDGMEAQLPPGLSEMQRKQIMKLIKTAEEGEQAEGSR
jgi:transcriptional regulator with XRE-family HTH domain